MDRGYFTLLGFHEIHLKVSCLLYNSNSSIKLIIVLYFSKNLKPLSVNETDLLSLIVASFINFFLNSSLKYSLNLVVEMFENWYTKKGAVRKKDLANREKFLIDSIFKSLGLDDSFIFEHKMFKIQSNEEKVKILISKIE